MRVGHHQRAIVVDKRHPVGPLKAVGDLAHAAVGADAHDASLSAVHVRISGGSHDQLVERSRAETGQIGERHERPIPLAAQQLALRPVDHEQAPVGKPVDAERNGPRRDASHHLTLAVGRDRQDFAGAPVAHPGTSGVPARRLRKAETIGHYACVCHPVSSCPRLRCLT